MAEPGQGQDGHGHHLRQLGDLALLGDHEAEGRPDQPETEMDPNQRRPTAPGHERGQPDLSAGLGPPPLLPRGVGLPPHERRARTREGHGPEELLAEAQPAGLDDPEQPGAERGRGEQHAPVRPPRAPVLIPHPAPPAASSPGRCTALGGIRNHKVPYAITPTNWTSSKADETDPDHHHRPAEMPGQAGADSPDPGASVTRVAREPWLVDSAGRLGRRRAVEEPPPRAGPDNPPRWRRSGRAVVARARGRLGAARFGGGHDVVRLTRGANGPPAEWSGRFAGYYYRLLQHRRQAIAARGKRATTGGLFGGRP